uniref:Uncharacterized protein n=2 Tax=Caenorhabditis japonica TaxID=281687 RepID=A0A8R1I1B0_CAEJA
MLLPCFIIALFLAASTFSMTLNRHYRRPICEFSQSCSYAYQQFTFELCDCPNMKACPTNHGIQLKGITYQFCSARKLTMCEPDEIAAEVDIIQTSIYCVCPHTEIYVKRKDESKSVVRYVCQEKGKKECEPGEICGVGNPIIGIKPLCQCQEDQQCVPSDSDVFNPISIQNATCMYNI